MASNRRGLPEINAGSMADIAFLLLIFFLVTTTMDQDTGINRKLPPMPEADQEKPPQINERNIYKVNISFKNEVAIVIDNKFFDMEISELKANAKKFIDNNGKNPKYSDSPEKAVISLNSDRGTEYKTYIRVQNELAAAYTELRNDASLAKFGERYADLDKIKQKEIRQMYPQKISEAEPKNIGGNE
jgi:biopolymer transport protein ExbD